MGNKRKCEDSDLYPASKCKMKKNKDSYMCRICDDQFDTIEELSTHRFSGNEGKKYKCNYCAKCYEKLSSKVELFHHLKTVHNGNKHYCPYCNLKFSLKYTLENHIDNEHKENNQSMSPKSDSDSPTNENVSLEQIFQCSICDHNLSSFHNLEVHTMIYHESKCPECYEQLSSKAELYHHLKTVHNEKKHCCPYCNSKFSLKYTLENHIDNKHKENNQSMSPKSDSDSSNHARIDNLREHSSSVQEENKLKKVTNNILKPVPNDEKIQNLGDSRKSLVGNTILINDHKSGLSVQANPKSVKTIAEDKIVQSETILKNSQSNESFTKIESEAILKNSPSNEPLTKIDYKCKLCKFETLETSSLKSHMVTGHKVDKTQTDWNKYISLCKRVVTIPNKLHLCPICEDQFAEIEELTEHITAVHEEKKPQNDSSKKLYLCTICREQFANIEELVKHYSSLHEKKKPQNDSTKKLYLCTICRDQFADIEELVKHYSSLHEEKKQLQSNYDAKINPRNRKHKTKKVKKSKCYPFAIENLDLRFPHLSEAIFDQLNNKTFSKCRTVSKNWCNIIEGQKSRWSRVLRNHIRNFKKSPESWKKIVNKFPFDMAKDLALTIKEFNINHYDPLHYAAIKGDLNMYKFIHYKSEDKNPKNVDGWMPIHFASRHGKIRIVEFIIENLEDKNPEDNSGLTPLRILAANGHLDVFKCIAKHGENINSAFADGVTLLHIAAAKENVDICNYILKIVTNKNPKDKRGNTPLHSAAEHGLLDLYKAIAQNLEAKNPANEDRVTPLYLAAKRGQVEVCEYILENVSNKNPQIKGGATPLHAAATNGHFGAYKCIAQHVNDKNPRQNNRKTPFDIAVKKGHLDICQYIVDNTNIKKQKNRLQKLVEKGVLRSLGDLK